ncbi:MAG: hypothetical protein KBD50_03555 [Candidatus Pacebacteria bacterium]|nr:hypothetical protein [Candidatus Paceibacterota bacterium]
MDELEIAGQRYLSTRRAGKEHKYHSDYIGQLIRGGKVVGKKVGRSWYVEAASLSAYLNGAVSAPAVAMETPIVKVTPVPAREIVRDVVKEEEVPQQPVEQSVTQPVTAEVLEEKIEQQVVEEKIEESQSIPDAPVPIKISKESVSFNATPVRRVPLDDAHKIQINAATKSDAYKSGGLRYISDDAPVLPVQTKKIAVVTSEEVPVYESEYLPTVEEIKNNRTGALSLAALAIVGIITFSITAGASVAISSQTIIEEGQVAGAGFTLK